MILNVKLVGTLFVLSLIAACGFFANGDLVFFALALAALCLLSCHMKKHRKYYESEIDGMYPDDKLS